MTALALLEEQKNLDPAIKKLVRYWLEANFDEKTKQEVADLIQHNPQGLIDAFYTNLAFGTGGLRGIMGVGSNRMNQYTVSFATQGLANYLKKEYGDKGELRVAIGYDSRHQSRFFAEVSARVLAGNGCRVFIFSELRPTPLVSFACRYHHCHAAIMVTASHNPPAYNGYKVYGPDGGQVLAPYDKKIIDEVSRLHDPDEVKLSDLSNPLIEFMKDDIDEAYLKAIRDLRLWPKETGGSGLKILYSALNGTGITMVPEALRSFGFPAVGFVEEQKEPNGDFPTTPHPNPEEKEALQLGINKLMKDEYDLFIATDPDADRMGVVVRHKGEAVILNGNQIACIAAEYVCKARIENNQFPKNAAFVKSIVTSELFADIVRGHQAHCFDVLTGFKYIAEKIRQWEESKEFQYIFGAEESYSSLLGTHVRDKDAVTSTCMMAEIALHAKQEGKTLIDYLEAIYARYGVFREDLLSIEFPEGKEGEARIKEVIQRFREKTPIKLGGYQVVRVTDLLKPNSLPLSDVLILELEDGSKIVIRPSGTEPKMKLYLMVREKSMSKAEAKVATFKKELQAFIL